MNGARGIVGGALVPDGVLLVLGLKAVAKLAPGVIDPEEPT